MEQTLEHVNVLIVGAGLSGIGAAWHLQQRCPNKTFLLLEGRASSGGTWDLFRYPGIRSDSDMHTLGYSFRPWRAAKAIADGPSILEYIRDTASEGNIDKKIRFNKKVVSASWSSERARWLVATHDTQTGQTTEYSCDFLFMCSGYYRYSAGYTPEFDGIADFKGQVIHPQFWPENLDYRGKRVVIIGSGATAVTLAPAMAELAAQVTVLQRSPTYIVDRPSVDSIAKKLEARLPATLAYRLTRAKNILRGWFYYRLAKRRPDYMKKRMVGGVWLALGEKFDRKHYVPRYKPWDQRVCLIPDGDMFAAIRSGRVAMVTDQIERFDSAGIQTKDGQHLEADIVVTATGLELETLGGVSFDVDGKTVEFSNVMTYKGFMYSDVPNLAAAFGYTNASWTLKCDLTCAFVCRLLNHMQSKGLKQCTPVLSDASVMPQPLLSFTSSYVQRAAHRSPKQGSKAPWRLYQNYFLDWVVLRLGKVNDGVLQFK